MTPASKSGRELIAEIDGTITPTPTLWWLGHAGFVVRFATITFYIDPRLPAGGILSAEDIRHADLILATHAHAGHMDTAAISSILQASKSSKVVLPKSAADAAHAGGIPYNRMTTTDSDLRVEYFKDELYGRVYAVPSAHPGLDYTATGGYPYLGYLIRFGRWTIYHAGDCAMYEGLAARLKPFNVSVALLPVGSANFSAVEAARLGHQIGAEWIVPMHYDEPEIENGFVSHLLGHWPGQRFKIFQQGEKWTVPEE